MRTNTRLLFKTLLRLCKVDCVCDIGSHDGCDALKFRQILPEAVLLAFEANPLLYQKMTVNRSLLDSRIEILPYAVTRAAGTALFHVTDTDYDNLNEPNTGTSSLLVRQDLKIKETIEVKTCRIDEFIMSRYPNVQRVGLWIDAEGAEFGVLEGMAGIKTLVMTVHVETAWTPMREGQRVYADVESLMKSYGFISLGNNLAKGALWGDVVFVQGKRLLSWGCDSILALDFSVLSWLKAGAISSVLNRRCGPLYRFLLSVYTRLTA